jgi:CheY-like chemotaxis protein
MVDGEQKLVMVVDDEQDNIDTVTAILEKLGVETVSASSGGDCLSKVKAMKKKPDLILLDIMMPGTPVKKVVPKLKPIKVAYLSVVNPFEARQEGLLAFDNIVDFIRKPFDTFDLEKKLFFFVLAWQ